MKTKLLFALLFIFSLNSKAQLDSFKLADYKLADLKRQSVDINFDAVFGNYEANYYETTNGLYKSTNFESAADIIYRQYRNTRNYQGDQSISFSNTSLFDLDKEEPSLVNDNIKQLRKNFISGLSVNSYNSFFFNNLIFIGVAGRVGYQHYYSKDENEDYLDNQLTNKTVDKNKSSSYFVSAPLSVGKGRIEPVEDARQSLYILKELKKHAKLARIPSKEEILHIATSISKFKNKRVLDSRLKKIYELKQLDSLLMDMGLIGEADISYFTIINDLWDFGGLQQRNAGYKIALEYSPQYKFMESRYETKSEDLLSDFVNEEKEESNISYFVNLVGISYLLQKPFKQKFQHTFRVGLNYSKTNIIDSVGIYYISEDKVASAGTSYYLGIYPTTRTDFTIGGSINLSKRWEQDGSNKNIGYGSYLRSSLNYYFSPRLRMNLNYTFWYDKYESFENENANTEHFNHSANITLLYSIF